MSPNQLTIINIIANKYNMTIDVDFEKGIINFVGNYNKRAEIACAKELFNLFGE